MSNVYTNNSTGIAVMIEALAGGYAGFKLTHVSFDVDAPEDGNTVIEVRTYGAGNMGAAIDYAKKCVADKMPKGEFLNL